MRKLNLFMSIVSENSVQIECNMSMKNSFGGVRYEEGKRKNSDCG